MYAFSTVCTYTSSYINIQSILYCVGKLIKDIEGLTSFATLCVTGLTLAKSEVLAVAGNKAECFYH